MIERESVSDLISGTIFLNYDSECDNFVMNTLRMVRMGTPKEPIPSSNGFY